MCPVLCAFLFFLHGSIISINLKGTDRYRLPDLLSCVSAHQADVKHTHTREKTLYEAVCSASTWLDGAENSLLSGPVLLSDDSEIQLCHLEVRSCYYLGGDNVLATRLMN